MHLLVISDTHTYTRTHDFRIVIKVSLFHPLFLFPIARSMLSPLLYLSSRILFSFSLSSASLRIPIADAFRSHPRAPTCASRPRSILRAITDPVYSVALHHVPRYVRGQHIAPTKKLSRSCSAGVLSIFSRILLTTLYIRSNSIFSACGNAQTFRIVEKYDAIFSFAYTN